uniref:Uncharacterized protein n=1 Tax=Arundo donax TaxID=35708 RepID=A0A0A9C8W9_ARUDO
MAVEDLAVDQFDLSGFLLRFLRVYNFVKIVCDC